MSELRQRKYNILPGVSIPGLDEILAATSDYSEPGELHLRVDPEVAKAHQATTSPLPTNNATPEDIAELQRLGMQVSQEEAKAMLESQKKMAEIKSRAVMAPQSMESLMEAAINAEEDEGRREQLETERKARAAAQAEAEAKKRELEAARAERRAQQNKAFEEFLAVKAENPQPVPVKETPVVEEVTESTEITAEETTAEVVEVTDIDTPIAEETAPVVEDSAKSDEVVEEVKAEIEPVATVSLMGDSEDAEARMLSDEETFDDFSDFL